MDITAETAADLLARLCAEGHGLSARRDGAMIDLGECGLRITVDAPRMQDNGLVVQLPIGVGHPRWSGEFAWDQAVGIGGRDRHPVANALDGWVHNVLPVFAAMALPDSDLAERAWTARFHDGTRAMDVHYGPATIRDFGGLTEEFHRAVADRPPTMAVVEELFTGYALPDRPIWLFTFCARTPGGPITEVTLLNSDIGTRFGHIADHLPWQGHGTVKSWALAVPR